MTVALVTKEGKLPTHNFRMEKSKSLDPTFQYLQESNGEDSVRLFPKEQNGTTKKMVIN